MMSLPPCMGGKRPRSPVEKLADLQGQAEAEDEDNWRNSKRYLSEVRTLSASQMQSSTTCNAYTPQLQRCLRFCKLAGSTPLYSSIWLHFPTHSRYALDSSKQCVLGNCPSSITGAHLLLKFPCTLSALDNSFSEPTGNCQWLQPAQLRPTAPARQ
jgi:hypothetical protein